MSPPFTLCQPHWPPIWLLIVHNKCDGEQIIAMQSSSPPPRRRSAPLAPPQIKTQLRHCLGQPSSSKEPSATNTTWTYWQNIPLRTIHNTVAAMLRHYAAMIAARGGHNQYLTFWYPYDWFMPPPTTHPPHLTPMGPPFYFWLCTINVMG